MFEIGLKAENIEVFDPNKFSEMQVLWSRCKNYAGK
jgi:hypothetical protein